MSKVSYFYNVARFIANKHLHGYQINPEPSFDPDGLQFFHSIIRDASIYLEFGSGGSTLLAARFVKMLVSVENDLVFARAVRKAIPESKAEIQLISPYIGITGEWGYPVFARPTAPRVSRWTLYPKAPWQVLNGRTPDTILVDGRMRVACTLESLMRVSRDTRLLIDDYAGRKYSSVESFADLIAMHGRMAEFRKRIDFDELACRGALNASYSDLG